MIVGPGTWEAEAGRLEDWKIPARAKLVKLYLKSKTQKGLGHSSSAEHLPMKIKDRP
jgi:hypothetical protein